MTQQIQKTDTSTTIRTTKVADYIVERIAAEGVSHCFGVAGDECFQYAMRSTGARRCSGSAVPTS